jgi:hypothetical protein
MGWTAQLMNPPLDLFDLTDEQVKAANVAGRLAGKFLDGTKLHEAFTIGESLLVGRVAAMKAAQVNEPKGRPYAEFFAKWKRAYHFPEGKEAEAFYDDCIVCAQHRETAESILTALPIKTRAGMGVSGLAKRVRARLKEDLEGPPPPRKPRVANAEEIRIANDNAELRTALAQTRENPFPWWNGSAKEAARSIFQDRGDGRRPEGKGRQLIVALAQEFKDWFPALAGELLDELTRILKGDA